MAETDLLSRAWELSYLDPAAARREALALTDGPLAAEARVVAALNEVRIGATAPALALLAGARDDGADARLAALADEVRAIALRREGDYAASQRLQAELDARPGVETDAMHRFVAHNSRAITCRVLGLTEDALRHFYAASEAADATGWAGPRITALSNLGGYHLDQYNLEDARRLTEQALAAARQAGARQNILTACSNLITCHHAAGEAIEARALVAYLHDHQHELVPGALAHYSVPMAMGHLGVGEVDAALGYLEQGALGDAGGGDTKVLWASLVARCELARGNAAAARRVAEEALHERGEQSHTDPPYDRMSLYRALADACEQCGDPVAALRCMREAHALYEQLVGRSARARLIALEVGHQLAQAHRERDQAVDGRRFVEHEHRRLAELHAQLQAQMAETAKLHAQLQEQALRDPLTGLHNRRYLFETAPPLLELARRQGSLLCVVLMDLDHFKLLNDTYGHAAGDLVLQRFSSLLGQMLRKSDIVARHGGEEFVAVMPDIDGVGAHAMLTRLLEAFQSQQPELGRRRLPRGSFSAGIACFPRHGSTLEQLLSRADRGLYSAKHQGRARIELAPRTGFGTLT